METVCIGCGCSDNDACELGCGWLRNDPITLLGVCSECPGHVSRFDAGDQKLSVAALEYACVETVK